MDEKRCLDFFLKSSVAILVMSEWQQKICIVSPILKTIYLYNVRTHKSAIMEILIESLANHNTLEINLAESFFLNHHLLVLPQHCEVKQLSFQMYEGFERGLDMFWGNDFWRWCRKTIWRDGLSQDFLSIPSPKRAIDRESLLRTSKPWKR